VGDDAGAIAGFPPLQPGLPGLRVTVISKLCWMKADSEKIYQLILGVRIARVKRGPSALRGFLKKSGDEDFLLNKLIEVTGVGEFR
jgi:hypothetical protein